MATTLNPNKYPNDWLSGVTTVSIPVATVAVDQYVMKCHRDTVVDGFKVRYTTAGTDSNSVTVMLQSVPNTDAIGGASTSQTSTSQGVQYALDLLSSAVALNTSANANTEVSGTVNTTNNLVKAGRWLALNFTGTMTGLVGCSIDILYRTAPGPDSTPGKPGGQLPSPAASLD